MRCCADCFIEFQIHDIIISQGTRGCCELCGNYNDKTIEITSDSPISGMIHRILDIYSVVPNGFPEHLKGTIASLIHDKWNIFSKNINEHKILDFLKNIFSSEELTKPNFFSDSVGILDYNNPEYLLKNSIIKDGQWDNFVSQIICVNRFHTDLINKDKLKEYLQCLVKIINPSDGKIYYRGRISPQKLDVSEMGAPPPEFTRSGRINPEGISVLYLSDKEETTLYEVRAMKHQNVCIGKFRVKEPLKIIDLSSINQISPFINDNILINYPLNIEYLRAISDDLLKPISIEKHLDYLPIQYICDYIKYEGFDGVEYLSTMHEGCKNFAFFKNTALECFDTYNVRINDINYKYQNI